MDEERKRRRPDYMFGVSPVGLVRGRASNLFTICVTYPQTFF